VLEPGRDLPAQEALQENSGIAVLRGNLCPDGAIIKPSAATPKLMKHRGRAVVFESIEDFHKRIDDPKLAIDKSCVMVLKNCGPKGYPGMAEVGNMPLPPKLLKRGITDMVRVSDARMSGTAYGTVVLHVAPEAARAAHSRSSRTATKSSSTSRSAGSSSSFRRRSSRKGAGNGKSRSPRSRGATGGFISTTCCRQRRRGSRLSRGKSGAFVPRDNH